MLRGYISERTIVRPKSPLTWLIQEKTRCRPVATGGTGSNGPVLLLAVLAVGVYQVWPSRTGPKLTRVFTNAVGLYPGDEVRNRRCAGWARSTPSNRGPSDVKIEMTLGRGVKVPADAKALIPSPNLVSARFVQLTPAYTEGDDDGRRRVDRTGPHRRPRGVGRGQGATHAAQFTARAAGQLGPGPDRTVRRSSGHHVRRQRRLVP